MSAKTLVCVVIVTIAFAARGPAQNAEPKPQADAAQTTPAPAPSQTGDALAQMQADLTRLDSLNNVMSSEIEFLHDQNLQILLRTNSQMWTVLVRDLKRLIDREE